MRESHRQPNNVLIRVDHESDTDSTDSVSRGSSGRRTTTSGDTPIDGPEARRGHYRGITFEEILPPQFISNAPSPTVEPKHGPVRRSANADAPPPASESAVRRSYPPAKKSSDGKSNSRIRNTARALARGLSIMKKRDSQGYETVR